MELLSRLPNPGLEHRPVRLLGSNVNHCTMEDCILFTAIRSISPYNNGLKWTAIWSLLFAENEQDNNMISTHSEWGSAVQAKYTAKVSWTQHCRFCFFPRNSLHISMAIILHGYYMIYGFNFNYVFLSINYFTCWWLVFLFLKTHLY